MVEEKIRYLTQAHHAIRRILVAEQDSVEEYNDVVSMLEFAGSTAVVEKVRAIRAEKCQHLMILKKSADFLRQAINRMEKERA